MNPSHLSIMNLGSFGDVIHSLPIAKYHSQREPINFVISDKYASVLEGVSYVEPVVCPVPYHDLPVCLEWAHKNLPRLINVFLWNHPATSRTRFTSFCEEMFFLGGCHPQFGHWFPDFDRRHKQREENWVNQLDLSRPIIAYTINGDSHHFTHQAFFESSLVHRFGRRCSLVNTVQNMPPRIYDMLALFERAKVIITIDTATLHLAKACQTPTIEIIAFLETFRDSTPGPYCKMRIKDVELRSRMDEMLDVVEGLI